jgi:alpha-L-fucosidase
MTVAALRVWPSFTFNLFPQAEWTQPSAPVSHDCSFAWQEREVELFLHFGINTSVGADWGSGKASPQFFNPAKLDCRHWVAAVRSGGARGAALTVKHHDSFCLWRMDIADYSMRASPGQAGKGNVIREFMAACLDGGRSVHLTIDQRQWGRIFTFYIWVEQETSGSEMYNL